MSATSRKLLLGLFVLRVSTAPTTVFLELYFPLDKLLILARPIVRAATLLARQFYKLILGHKTSTIAENRNSVNFSRSRSRGRAWRYR